MSDRAEPKRKDKELSAEKNEKDKTSSDEQGSSGPPRCDTGIPFQHKLDML
jgi:hypothetical protein